MELTKTFLGEELDDLSEFRKGDFVVQVAGFGSPTEHRMMYRTTDVVNSPCWTEWRNITDEEFQHIDRQARNELVSESDASPLYAKHYMDILS